MQEIKRLNDELRGSGLFQNPRYTRCACYNSFRYLRDVSFLINVRIDASKLKEVHVLESSSQSEMIENLQDQLATKAQVGCGRQASKDKYGNQL